MVTQFESRGQTSFEGGKKQQDDDKRRHTGDRWLDSVHVDRRKLWFVIIGPA